MKKINKKGVGLVMSIMIITVLMIMASGFFVVTRHMTNTSQSELEKLRLYWAAESGSNYSINWWVNQDNETRIFWPYFYDPEGEAKLFSGNDNSGSTGGSDLRGGGGNNPDDEDIPPPSDWDYDFTDGTDAEGSTGDNWVQEIPEDLHDAKGYLALFDTSDIPGYLPPVCNGIATDNKLYLHSSSEKISMQYPDSKDSYTLYLLRYKGERVDKKNAAVWVMDTWAVDDQTGDTYRVMMSNLYNFNPTSPEWLQYAESMVHTQWASTNGRRGVYKYYDYRFGQSYFAEQVRFDYKSGSIKVGPTFYGKIASSSEEQSCYGASVGNPTLIPLGQGVEWEYGLFAESTSFRSVADAVSTINGSVLGGWDAVDSLDADNIVWDWPTIEENSSLTPEGIYMLSDLKYPHGSEIDIKLYTVTGTDGELDTFADISVGGSVIETVEVSDNDVSAIAVPTEYGTVSIYGNSSDSFSLMTEEDVVQVTDHFYLAELEWLKDLYAGYSDLNEPTMEMMAYLYESMYDVYPDAHLSILSGIALSDMEAEDLSDIPALGNRTNQIDLSSLHGQGLLFTTCGYYLGYGDLGTPSSQNADLRLYNIGSYILNTQVETTGSNSFKGTIAFIQDKRFYDEDFVAGPGWGSGPGDDSEPISGLNNKYRWTGGYAGVNTITESNFEYLVSVR